MKDLAEFREKYPDIYQAIFEEGETAGHERGFSEGEGAGIEKASKENQDQAKADGAKAERERIQAVQDQLIPGHDELIQTLMFDGKTSGPEAAVKVLAAEKKLRTDVLKDHLEDAPDPVPDPSTDKDPSMKVEDKDLPIDERAYAEWEKDPKVRKEFDGDYDAFLAAKTAMEKGHVKIIGKKDK